MTRPSLLAALSLCLSCSATPPPEPAAPPPPAPQEDGAPWQEAPEKPRVAPRSVGTPDNGRLEGAVAWEDSRSARRPPGRSSARFGTPELIGLLHRASRAVATRFPPSVLSVGDLSALEGGPIPGHNSHQNGRDVDVAFYCLDEQRNFTFVEEFAVFASNGKHQSSRVLWFDDNRNFTFVEALLTDPEVEVRTIFIANHLKERLLRKGIETGAPQPLLTRAGALMQQPPNSAPHDDHFHIRISCPAAHKPACVDHSVGLPAGMVTRLDSPPALLDLSPRAPLALLPRSPR